jgi:hypothetical protein
MFLEAGSCDCLSANGDGLGGGGEDISVISNVSISVEADLRKRGEVRRGVFVAGFEIGRLDEEVVEEKDAFDDIDCNGARGLEGGGFVRRGLASVVGLGGGGLGGEESVRSRVSIVFLDVWNCGGGGGGGLLAGAVVFGDFVGVHASRVVCRSLLGEVVAVIDFCRVGRAACGSRIARVLAFFAGIGNGDGSTGE